MGKERKVVKGQFRPLTRDAPQRPSFCMDKGLNGERVLTWSDSWGKSSISQEIIQARLGPGLCIDSFDNDSAVKAVLAISAG